MSCMVESLFRLRLQYPPASQRETPFLGGFALTTLANLGTCFLWSFDPTAFEGLIGPAFESSSESGGSSSTPERIGSELSDPEDEDFDFDLLLLLLLLLLALLDTLASSPAPAPPPGLPSPSSGFTSGKVFLVSDFALRLGFGSLGCFRRFDAGVFSQSS